MNSSDETATDLRGARSDVLKFYRDLPFNFYADASVHASELRRLNPLWAYPPLIQALRTRPRLLDVGSGTGWLVHAAALHHGCASTGIDFNPVAVQRAQTVAGLLGVDAVFEVADLFAYRAVERFGMVTSIGVLHHTNDCLGGIAHAARLLVGEAGRMFIGLYHAFGRRPFLSHFDRMRRRGAGEDAMYLEFRNLRTGSPIAANETFSRSWFRDQVLHPHESCHTLAEVLPVIEDLGFVLESTSINRFGPIPADITSLIQ